MKTPTKLPLSPLKLCAFAQLGPVLLTVMSVGLMTGCTTFKYSPKHAQVYDSLANRGGLAISTGTDSRLESAKLPAWAKNAESIVAHALAEEIKHAKLFDRVKIHAGSATPKRYSEFVRFRVVKFECAERPMFLENWGKRLLQFQGIRGALIAESIPSKYVAEVELEFEVFDAPDGRSVLSKTYSASQEFNANGYEGSASKMQNTSAVLESVIAQFVRDLVKLPLSQQAPFNSSRP
jgi:hypothetical protein